MEMVDCAGGGARERDVEGFAKEGNAEEGEEGKRIRYGMGRRRRNKK